MNSKFMQKRAVEPLFLFGLFLFYRVFVIGVGYGLAPLGASVFGNGYKGFELRVIQELSPYAALTLSCNHYNTILRRLQAAKNI